jgi:hypothetical protein
LHGTTLKWRRFVICCIAELHSADAGIHVRPADYKSAMQQDAILRYDWPANFIWKATSARIHFGFDSATAEADSLGKFKICTRRPEAVRQRIS